MMILYPHFPFPLVNYHKLKMEGIKLEFTLLSNEENPPDLSDADKYARYVSEISFPL